MGRTLLSDAFEVDFDSQVSEEKTHLHSDRVQDQNQNQRRRTGVSAPHFLLVLLADGAAQGYARISLHDVGIAS